MEITPVVHKTPLKSLDEKMNDLNYWLAQPLVKRLEAVTFLISQTKNGAVLVFKDKDEEQVKALMETLPFFKLKRVLNIII